MALTKHQIDRIVKYLSSSLACYFQHSVYLKVDDFEKITLQVRLYEVSGLTFKYCIVPFINGKWKHEWDNIECREGKLFCRKSEFYLVKNKKERDKFRCIYKQLSKLGHKNHEDYSKKKHVLYLPAWFSPKKLIQHLIDNSSNIDLIGPEELLKPEVSDGICSTASSAS